MSLKTQITEDMKTAMRAKDAPRLSTIRLILSAIKQREVDERKELTDADVVAVIEKMIKQRRESIAQYERASRKDLADVEKFELQLLGGYLPQQLSDAELSQAVDAAVGEAKPTGIKDMGKVMALL
ncbi:MAG TPA: GatB/YqeY domain-containing protein, partial [Burkholderiales bacterium]|nr:GatB/YqeY domain-containing protein [Burkholderiales bacterium]